MSSREPSTTAAGEAVACSKKASAFGLPHRRQHVEDVGIGADRTQQHPERRLANKGHMTRTAAKMPSEPKP
eukprot:1685714-Pleurochrysis_carterae.AAC.1